MLSKAPALPGGTPRNIFLTLLHHPTLLKRFNALAGTFMRFGLIPADERELVILRVAGRTGSRYELAQHVPLARAEGVDDELIRSVLNQNGAPPLRGHHALLMGVTDELLDRGDLSDAQFSALCQRYEPAAVLELLCLIGFYRMAADVLMAARVTPEDEPSIEVDLGCISHRTPVC